jgi:capsular polysaccharide export protein
VQCYPVNSAAPVRLSRESAKRGQYKVEMKRRFLFLQGVSSPFFPRLADRLQIDGHAIYRVNFNCGDRLYWGRRPAWNFRDDVGMLGQFLLPKFEAHGFTDVLLFGDRRPVHLPAITLAKQHGARIQVFEEGYFRPHWVTLEREGVNGNSLLPKVPAWYLEVGPRLARQDYQPVSAPLWVRAGHDMAYHLANIANPLLHPAYRTHSPYNSALEYAGLGKRYSVLAIHERKDRARTEHLIGAKTRYFVLPLQLNSDAQIMDHSPFRNMSEVLDRVLRSFAAHAPGDAQLVIKNHPFDPGFANYPKAIRRFADELGLEGRLHYMETGDLHLLLAHAQGMVTVNSTAGTIALEQRCPVVALADAIYNLPGLTFQQGLDRFWQEGAPPDAKLFAAFRATVMHTSLVNGSFYTAHGIDMVIAGSRRILEAERSPLEELLS